MTNKETVTCCTFFVFETLFNDFELFCFLNNLTVYYFASAACIIEDFYLVLLIKDWMLTKLALSVALLFRLEEFPRISSFIKLILEETVANGRSIFNLLETNSGLFNLFFELYCLIFHAKA